MSMEGLRDRSRNRLVYKALSAIENNDVNSRFRRSHRSCLFSHALVFQRLIRQEVLWQDERL
jgi:hypothetical protein